MVIISKHKGDTSTLAPSSRLSYTNGIILDSFFMLRNHLTPTITMKIDKRIDGPRFHVSEVDAQVYTSKNLMLQKLSLCFVSKKPSKSNEFFLSQLWVEEGRICQQSE